MHMFLYNICSAHDTYAYMYILNVSMRQKEHATGCLGGRRGVARVLALVFRAVLRCPEAVCARRRESE